MHEETLKDKTAKGLFWGGVSNGLQQILSLIFGIILLRVLNAEDYGMVGMLAIFMGIASTIQESGFTAALINKKEFKHEDYNAVFWFSLFSSVVMYIILFFSAPLIAWFFEKPELTNLSRLLFLGIVIGGIGVAHNAILLKRLMVKERAKIDIMALLISGITGVFLALNGFSYWGLAIQSVTYVGVSTFAKCYFSLWKPTMSFKFSPLNEMLSFSLKLFLTNIFWQINTNIFSVLLGKFYDPKQVGYYSQGNKWMTMGSTIISGMINGIAQPVLVQISDDIDRQRNAFRKMLRFGAFVSFPLMLGLAFVAKEFLLIAGGEKWLPSVPFLQLFCIWGSVYYIWNLYVNILMAYGKSNIYLTGIVGVGVSQLLALVIVFPYGIYPMIIVYILLFFVGILFWHYNVERFINMSLREMLYDISPYLIVSVGVFLLVWCITCGIENIYLLFFMKIIFSVIFYVLVLWFAKSVVLRESVSFLYNKIKNNL